MIEKDKTSSNNKKKLYLSIGGISLLFIISILVISPSRYINNYSFNSIKPYYSIPEELDYEGYQKITKLETLLPGTSMVFVGECNSNLVASTTVLNDSPEGFLVGETVTLTDNHINPTDPFTYNTYSTFCVFESDNKYLFVSGSNNKIQYGAVDSDSETNFTVLKDAKGTYVKRRSIARYITIGSSSPVFFADNTKSYIDVYVSVDSVLEQWINTYHLNQNVSGQCLTYFNDARESLLAMDSYVIADLYYNNNYSEYKERYEAWAKYHKVDPYHE